VLAGLDPLVNVTTALTGLGSVGLMALLSVTALAIPVFFARRRMVSLSRTVAPAIGGVIISIATTLAFTNYSVLTGVDSTIINHLPYVLLVVAIVGATQAAWLRRNRPDIYSRIGSTRVDEPADAKDPTASAAGDPATSLNPAAGNLGR